MPDGRQLLLDYGQVISRPPGTAALRRLVAAAGVPEAALLQGYWEHRVPYDAGQPAEAYWTAVLGRPPGTEQLRDLVDADVEAWLDLEPAVLDALDRLHAQRTPVSLLSNAPRELGVAIAAHPAFAAFRHLLFSADLGLVKPDPRIYAVAVERLGARPEDVVFVDDRPDNVEAAAAAGLLAVRHTGDLGWLVSTGLLDA